MNSQQGVTPSDRLVYGLTLQQLSGLDPHINASSELGIPLRQVYDTLVYRNPDTNEFVPGLADTWTISEDGLVYTFHLKQDIQFHDGTAFNAEAVAATLDRITNPENASQKAIFLLGPYKGYEIVDDYTIQVLLGEPYSPLLDSFAQVYLGIASPKAIAEYSATRYQFHQVGSGPFIFADYIPGARIILKRNPNYWGGPLYYQEQGDNSVDEIEFRFFVDPPTRALAVSNSEAQIMGEILPTDAREMTGNRSVKLLPVSVPGQPLQFLMNVNQFPTDNLAVRQAILYSTNRNAIVDAIFQRFSPIAWGPLAATTLYYSRAMNGTYAHDTSQAQSLLSGAGYSDSNNDGYLDFGGIDLEVTVIVPPWGLIPEVSQLLQDQWRTIGIKATLRSVPTLSALQEQVNSGDYNLVAFYSFGLDPAILNAYFMTGGTMNWTGFSNQELDTVLQDAVRQTDPAIRRSLYADAQRIIMDAALILPIRDYVNLNIAEAKIDNLHFDSYGWFPILNNVTLNESE